MLATAAGTAGTVDDDDTIVVGVVLAVDDDTIVVGVVLAVDDDTKVVGVVLAVVDDVVEDVVRGLVGVYMMVVVDVEGSGPTEMKSNLALACNIFS